ncbi:hypothetical protein IQ246_17930 [aff. Roholtiella sp. LEGE 12411]|nr:hypothetical protein [aff. Roholtiella sp. LEGE 12411]
MKLHICRHLSPQVASPGWTLPPTTAIVQAKPAALDLMRLIENDISIVIPPLEDFEGRT